MTRRQRRGQRAPGERTGAAPALTPTSTSSISPPTPASAASGRSIANLIREEDGRLLVSVRVTPRAGRDALALEGGILRVRLAAAPIDGAANAALLSLLATRLRIPTRAVTLVRGATSREKLIAIAGISAADFWQRLRI